MHNHYTSEQQMLADGVARFVREHGRFEDWRKLTAAGAPFDEANWKRMAEMGWLALAIPEEHGGYGASIAETMIVAEGLGRGLLREPFVSTCVMAVRLLARAGNSTQHGLFEGIADGSGRIATALAESAGRFHLNRVHTRAVPVNGGYRLNGAKAWVPDASSAQWFVVPARTQGTGEARDGISLFLVPADAPGLQRSDFRSPDHQHIGQLQLDGVEVPASALIGPLHAGLALLEDAVDHAIAARLAEACGAMDAVSEMTLEYLKVRKQFGTTIGSFQALQHRMVDMTIACEEARSMLLLAQGSLDAEPAQRQRAIAAAKARVGQCGLYVGHQAVQLHGGVGTSDELAVSHYLKRLSMIDLAFGNADHQRDRFIALSDEMAPAQASSTSTARVEQVA
ncbi:acyl-CoA dehydrogenase family protein [Hydrogenophaga sp. BPS33]|uniref:acyl-CoA dehydrogenase family protein n=1 Tax=Hydrogenophaga sp. BPS33 TaxID=2651974 RepID=UPI00131F7A45|nr:acyl-CoA dehydrogenase [Hydrogenophaga sp. BPS33]QHE84472.1 acyl-CoA dehydrogenase [Hydrogenophaga sp. BPS33]